MLKFQIPNGITFMPCPHCEEPIALFQTYRSTCVVLNQNGTLHLQTCEYLNPLLHDWHETIKRSTTTYDQLVLGFASPTKLAKLGVRHAEDG